MMLAGKGIIKRENSQALRESGEGVKILLAPWVAQIPLAKPAETP
jgi:hypothetical protein